VAGKRPGGEGATFTGGEYRRGGSARKKYRIEWENIGRVLALKKIELQPGGQFDLPLEAVRTERLSELGMEHLERHRPVVAEVLGQKHGSHAATAKLAFEAVPVGQAVLELLAQVCHPRPWFEGSPLQYRE
jgi:hypothetical protein